MHHDNCMWSLGDGEVVADGDATCCSGTFRVGRVTSRHNDQKLQGWYLTMRIINDNYSFIAGWEDLSISYYFLLLFSE